MKKILIYEANSSQALAVSKFIKKHSNYKIIGVIEKPILFNKKNYDEIIIEKFENIDKKDYDYILPMGAYSTFKSVKKFKILFYENDIYYSDKNLIVFDKLKMLKIAQSINIPIPKTYYSKDNIDSFPIFYKEDFEKGGGIRGIAYKLDEIPLSSNLIYQEYINTPSTYSVGFLAKNGEILTFTIHKEVISYPKDGGSAVIVEEYNDKRLLVYTKKILKEINYNGWGLAEYKYCDKRDDFVFMEINGKFWASIEFLLKNNPDFLKLLLNIEYSPGNIKKIFFISRFLHYDFFTMIKYLKKLKFERRSKEIKIVKEESLFFQILKKMIPNNLKIIIKRLLINENFNTKR